jgi:hypothetical protein
VSGGDTRTMSREYPHIACAHAGYVLIVLRTDAIRDVPIMAPRHGRQIHRQQRQAWEGPALKWPCVPVRDLR